MRWRFRLNRREKDGSLHDHLLSVWKQTGKKPPGLEEPPCPFYLSHVVDWWFEIRSGLSPNGFTVPALTWEALLSWATFRRMVLRRAEVTLLFLIENVYQEEQAERMKVSHGATSGA